MPIFSLKNKGNKEKDIPLKRGNRDTKFKYEERESISWVPTIGPNTVKDVHICPKRPYEAGIPFVLQLTRLRSKKIMMLPQGHTASKWQSEVYRQKLVLNACIFKYVLCLAAQSC